MVLRKYITRNVSLDYRSIEEKKKEIEGYFLKTYGLFESLFRIFKTDEAFYQRPESLRHPLIFYYGHTATFFVNKLILAKQIKERINPKFEAMFAIGVDEMSWDDLNQENYQWPPVEEVRAYRNQVKDLVLSYIREATWGDLGWESPMWPILMGIEHEKIHIETSSVLHRQLDLSFIRQDSCWNEYECKGYGKHPENSLIPVAGRVMHLGKPVESNLYGWDLEYGHYSENVKDFKASKFLVSNGEFLAFVKDGGYQRDAYWSYEGRQWKAYKKVKHPVFWIEKDDTYYYRTLTDCIALPLSWPVDVNYLEAEAFCRWKSLKTDQYITLPTEAQWHAFREYCEVDDDFNYGDFSNINLEHFSSACGVNVFEFRHGFFDVVGNVWQWTKTPIFPFEGFKVHPIYDDFSVPTFDQRHNLLMGGSWISTGNEATKYARYAFRRHFYQHAGFRYIAVDALPKEEKKKYDYDAETINILEHVSLETLEGFLSEHLSEGDELLNLGANQGELVLALKTSCENKMMAIDFTARHVLLGQKKIDKKKIENIAFFQGDACNLKHHFKGYKAIIATNNTHELYHLERFMDTLNERLNAEGVLVLALQEFDGFEQKEALLQGLSEHFTCLKEEKNMYFFKKK